MTASRRVSIREARRLGLDVPALLIHVSGDREGDGGGGGEDGNDCGERVHGDFSSALVSDRSGSLRIRLGAVRRINAPCDVKAQAGKLLRRTPKRGGTAGFAGKATQ